MKNRKKADRCSTFQYLFMVNQGKTSFVIQWDAQDFKALGGGGLGEGD